MLLLGRRLPTSRTGSRWGRGAPAPATVRVGGWHAWAGERRQSRASVGSGHLRVPNDRLVPIKHAGSA